MKNSVENYCPEKKGLSTLLARMAGTRPGGLLEQADWSGSRRPTGSVADDDDDNAVAWLELLQHMACAVGRLSVASTDNTL